MTEHLEVDGKTFIKASLAADRVGYTPDYVTRLARSEKILASKSGGAWYVDPESLKLFALNAEAEKRERSEQIREARLRERGVVVRDLYMANLHDRAHAMSAKAIAQTAVISVSIFMLLNFVWFTLEAELNVKNIAHASAAFAGEVADTVMEPLTATLSQFASFAFIEHRPAASVNAEPVAETVNAANSANPEFQGIVVFEEASTSQKQLEAVRRSFSDEVDVEFESDDTGIVRPVFRERDGESYRFLLVPVRPPGE